MINYIYNSLFFTIMEVDFYFMYIAALIVDLSTVY